MNACPATFVSLQPVCFPQALSSGCLFRYNPGVMRGVFCTKDLTSGIDGKPASVLDRLSRIMPGSDIFCMDQVHSDRIVLADEAAPQDVPQADGIISRNPDHVLCVRTADCVPVLLWANDMPLNAAVHAGWRGLALRIVAKCVRMMRSLGAEDIRAAIGPSIGPCCYVVGRDVADALGAEPRINGSGSLVVDLRAVARSQLTGAGLEEDAIESRGPCTACRTDRYFSYRRQGQLAGRNVSLIGGKSWSLPGLQVG